MPVLSAFLIGALFAVGLGISGMTLPERVLGFLDVTGGWDPTLLFVMGGATGVYFLFYRVLRRSSPLLGGVYRLPAARRIDQRLLAGAMVFGIGWGLAGYCPGPALTSLGGGVSGAFVMVAGMVGGMLLYELADSLTRGKRPLPGSGARGASARGSSG